MIHSLLLLRFGTCREEAEGVAQGGQHQGSNERVPDSDCEQERPD